VIRTSLREHIPRDAPDIILLDDIEDDEGNYSLHQKNSAWLRWVPFADDDRAVCSGRDDNYVWLATHDLVRTL